MSEYGRQLKDKQELRRQYNLRERQFSKYVKVALQEGSGGDAVETFLRLLEKRFDNVIFRAGIAQTRAQARQMASHEHFLVNGKKVNIPSYQVRIGDVISLHPSSKDSKLFNNAKIAIEKHEAPSWMVLDKDKLEVHIKGEPTVDDADPSVEIPLIFEFYSR